MSAPHLIRALFLLALGAYLPTVQAQDKTQAELVFRDGPLRVHLIKRDGDQIFYRLPDAPKGVQANRSVSEIMEARFLLEPYEDALVPLLDNKDIVGASRLLYKIVKPYIPYLDLPYNNAVDPALECASYLMQIAATAPSPDAAKSLYGLAETLYTSIAMATWHPWANTARLRIAQCWLGVGDLTRVSAYLDKLPAPSIGDGTYGLYWLVNAEWQYASKHFPAAIAAATRSVAFENKDVGSFPDALFLSAQAYEAVNEPHRARDVYYEIAHLFIGTEWHQRAVRELERLMDSGKTEVGEALDIQEVFFGLDQQDMNEVVRAYLKDLKTEEP